MLAALGYVGSKHGGGIKRKPGSPSVKIRKEGKGAGVGLDGSRGPKLFSFFHEHTLVKMI